MNKPLSGDMLCQMAFPPVTIKNFRLGMILDFKVLHYHWHQVPQGTSGITSQPEEA